MLMPAKPIKSMSKIYNAMKKINHFMREKSGEMMDFIDYLYKNYNIKIHPVFKDSICPGNKFLKEYYTYTENERKNLSNNILVKTRLVTENDLLAYNQDLCNWLDSNGYTYQLQGIIIISK